MSEVIVVLFVLAFVGISAFTPAGDLMAALINKEKSVLLAEERRVAAVYVEKTAIPQDSVLKRHFLTDMQAKIEEELFPRPSCSVLQRHYDSLVASTLENRLQEMTKA